VRVGERIVAYLQTGQILLRQPSPARMRWLAQQLRIHGIAEDLDRFTAEYQRGRIMARKQYNAVLRLLAIFAQQLGEFSNLLILQQAPSEQPAITRARSYIAEHHTEEIALTEVAQAVNMSRYHFCKVFHLSTGMTFTDYLARVRIEDVRQRLLDPETRISQAAYAAGFQSLSQFSRVFRRIVGESPSTYRQRTELAKSA
jgi:AraC-like DNA-binding protein